MSGPSVRALAVAPEHPVVADMLGRLGVDVVRLDPASVDAGSSAPADAERLVWLHMAPALSGADAVLDEASLLLRSAAAARGAAAEAGAALTFLALLPSHGLFADGERRLACELARGAFEALMRTQIDAWSARGDRLLGLVYAGLDGQELDGQRPAPEVRARTPQGGLASAGQIADAIRYLGSRHAAYVTGTLLHVDGGWNAYSWIYPARTI